MRKRRKPDSHGVPIVWKIAAMNLDGHILIIDDEASLRQTLARILQRAGFEVTTAANGSDGLALLSQHSFDLVYLDIRMPDMNGMDVLKAIQSKSPEVPVILFTAQPDLNSAVEALRRGAADYLLKPLKPQAVIDRTRAILAGRQTERRKREIQMQIETLQNELKTLEAGSGPQVPAPRQQAAESTNRFLKCGLLTLDLHTHRVTLRDRIVNLTPTSFNYLLVLARHAPNVVDFQTLVSEAQGYETDPREAQELSKWHIHIIREAIEPDKHAPVHVINVRRMGYRLVVD